jgi:hypothetical protein
VSALRDRSESFLIVPWNVDEAAELAHDLLGDSERFRHSQGVAQRARELSVTVPSDQVELLVAAAWLHDVGYAVPLRGTGFHPLDGARGLVGRGVGSTLARLVAHHSAAWLVAGALGLQPEMAAFLPLPGPTADALTAADQTIGPGGVAMTVDERMRDMIGRHGPDSPNASVHAARATELRATTTRVAGRLRRRGVTDSWLPRPSER